MFCIVLFCDVEPLMKWVFASIFMIAGWSSKFEEIFYEYIFVKFVLSLFLFIQA